MNYSDLQDRIASYTTKDDQTDIIPDFIAFAEARLNRELPVTEREMESIATIASDEISLPTDFAGMRSLYLQTDPIAVLEPIGLDELRRAYPDDTTGQPERYAITAGSSLVVAPYPDASYVFNLNYYQKIPALSDAEPTNWLIEEHPDAYLAASLVEAFSYMMDETRAAFWAAKLAGIIEGIREASIRKAKGGAAARLKTDIPALRSTFDITRG